MDKSRFLLLKVSQENQLTDRSSLFFHTTTFFSVKNDRKQRTSFEAFFSVWYTSCISTKDSQIFLLVKYNKLSGYVKPAKNWNNDLCCLCLIVLRIV